MGKAMLFGFEEEHIEYESDKEQNIYMKFFAEYYYNNFVNGAEK